MSGSAGRTRHETAWLPLRLIAAPVAAYLLLGGFVAFIEAIDADTVGLIVVFIAMPLIPAALGVALSGPQYRPRTIVLVALAAALWPFLLLVLPWGPGDDGSETQPLFVAVFTAIYCGIGSVVAGLIALVRWARLDAQEPAA